MGGDQPLSGVFLWRAEQVPNARAPGLPPTGHPLLTSTLSLRPLKYWRCPVQWQCYGATGYGQCVG